MHPVVTVAHRDVNHVIAAQRRSRDRTAEAAAPVPRASLRIDCGDGTAGRRCDEDGTVHLKRCGQTRIDALPPHDRQVSADPAIAVRRTRRIAQRSTPFARRNHGRDTRRLARGDDHQGSHYDEIDTPIPPV
jgi:hypothetical protein